MATDVPQQSASREQRKMVTAAPENSETPLDSARSWVTPNRLFFVRNHFDVPAIDVDRWRLRVEGCVSRPVELSWDDLAALPERSVFATVECAGNGRSFLRQAAGVPWGAGAVGHAEWTGVPLRVVLEQAGIKPETVEIVAEGADRGSEPDHPEPMVFARGLPLDKALDPDTLLATRMNGELLEPSHGAPVRLLVPGWYGVASVKWLQRLEAVDRPFRGYFQTVKYTVQRPTAGGIATVPIGAMAVKSEIIRPRAGEVLGVGTNRLFGVAWAGPHTVDRVEVSTDGGHKWNDAALLGPETPYSWTLWECLWDVAEAGDYTLLVRARASDGAVQPPAPNPLNGGYLVNFSRPRPVRVQAARRVHDQRSDAAWLVYDMNAFAEDNTRFPLDVEMEFSAGAGI